MITLDRELQRRLLREASDLYPQTVDVRKSWPNEDERNLWANFSYLAEHGLVELHQSQFLGGGFAIHSVRITARGLDFLADDGGLSAILGTITIRLHEDSIKSLLIRRIEESDADKSVKDRLIEKIRNLPAEGVSKVAMSAIDSGLAHLPNAILWLQKLLGL